MGCLEKVVGRPVTGALCRFKLEDSRVLVGGVPQEGSRTAGDWCTLSVKI